MSVRSVSVRALGAALALAAGLVLPVVDGGAAAHAQPASGSGNYTAISPQRFIDTRTTHRPLAAGSTTTYQITGGHGVPAAGVSAVMLNLTAVGQQYGGYVTVYPAGTARPVVSTVNFPAGQVVANQTLVAVDAAGRFTLFTYVAVHMVIDVVGWANVPSLSVGSADVVPVTPARVMDTRSGLGGRRGPLPQGGTASVSLAGRVPAGVTAVVLNVTALGRYRGSYLTVYPAGATRPGTSSVTLSQSIVANQVVVPLGAQSRVTVFSSAASTNVLIDVEGYVSDGPPGFAAVTPVRLTDTRRSNGGTGGRPLVGKRPLEVTVAGTAGVPADATSVLVNVTSIGVGGPGYTQAGPYGGLPNHSSVLNFHGGAVVSATVSVAIGPTGVIAITANTATHQIVDLLGWTARPSLEVTPPQADRLSLPLDPNPATDLARQILTNTNKYAMTTWWDNDAQALLSRRLDSSVTAANGTGDDPVRRLANQAFGLATALSLGTYDPDATGVDAATARSRVLTMIDYAASQHIANSENGWGAGWQSSFWAGYLARAAWLLWADLPDTDRTLVARMIRFEADDAAGRSPHYLRDRNGTYLAAHGDSGADDTSWWAMPMQLAAVMFPDDPHAAIWRYSYVRFALAAWSRPQDVTNNTVVQGRAVSAWVNGSNVESNGIVVNHVRVAPDYMTLLYQSTDDIWLHAFVGQSAPQADTALAGPVYGAYTSVTFAGSAYAPPGGTIYPPGLATIYYPQGNDWGTAEILPFALADATALAYGFGSSASSEFELLHAQAQLNLQQRFPDGHTYADSTEYRYAGREEQTSQLAAEMYLADYLRDSQQVTFDNGSYLLPSA